MGRGDLNELMNALRASIARLTNSGTTRDRALTRALAHLWSAHDELELLTQVQAATRAP